MQNTETKSGQTLETARKAHKRWLIKNNKKDLDKAIEYYSMTLATNPNIPESYYRLAMLLWESGQISLSTAIEKCNIALTVAPENIDAHMYAGYFFKLAGQYDYAENEFKKAVSLNPAFSSRARLNLGLLNFEKITKKQFQPSNFFKSFYYLSTGCLIGVLDFSGIQMRLQKCSEFLSVAKYLIAGNFYKVFRLDNHAIKTYKKACLKTRRREIFGKLIGDIDIKNENAEQAVKSYNQALAVNPYDREALLKKATILQTYFENKTDEAIDTYTKALETEGEKGYIYYELGHLYLKSNDLINAVNAFKLAIKDNQTNPFFQNALGYALFSAGQYDEAEDHYLSAINLNPEPEWTATVCRAVALIYSDVKKNNEKAIKMYQQSLALAPNCADTYASLGDIYFDDEDYDLALENYTKSLQLDRSDAYVFNKFATTLWQKDFTEEAIIAYKSAIDTNPDYAPAYNNLGVVYLDGKNLLSEAKECFEQAIEKDSAYTMAYYNAGRTFEALGDKINAAKNYQKAEELNQIKEEIKGIDISEKIKNLFEV